MYMIFCNENCFTVALVFNEALILVSLCINNIFFLGIIKINL